jgi:trehalose utilization protein
MVWGENVHEQLDEAVKDHPEAHATIASIRENSVDASPCKRRLNSPITG